MRKKPLPPWQFSIEWLMRVSQKRKYAAKTQGISQMNLLGKDTL